VAIIEINCSSVWREVSNFVDEEVDAELRARLDAHFKGCRHCTAILDGTRNVLRLVGDGRTFELPAGFQERLRQRMARLT